MSRPPQRLSNVAQTYTKLRQRCPFISDNIVEKGASKTPSSVHSMAGLPYEFNRTIGRVWNCILVCCLLFLHRSDCSDTVPQRRLLIFGGNGFLGASATEKFIKQADNVTIVNRGNWYWDSDDRIRPFVRHIVCDRTEETCAELAEYVASVDKFDAVFDFSAYGGDEVRRAATLIKGKVDLYILISTDSVYDVSGKDHRDPSKETDAFRPADEDERDLLNKNNGYGDRKLQAEEATIAQRLDGGFPFVILRLPDVLGPRDTTFRFWIYHLWEKVSKEITKRPLEIPEFLVEYPMSFVYVDDVADVIYNLTRAGAEVQDQAINLAWAQTFTMKEFLSSLGAELGLGEMEYSVKTYDEHPLFLYPSNRRGPVDVGKAESLLNWKPTPWEEVIAKTVQFYEKVIKDDQFTTQRDEIVQIVSNYLYSDDQYHFYKVLENIYDINLEHFIPKDEL